MTAALDSVTVTLPVPPYALSKNGRVNWREKNRLYQQHRFEATYRIHQATNYAQPCWSCPVQVTVRWFKPTARKLDYSNAVNRLDAYLDSAQAAGLYVDDAQIRGIAIEFLVDRANPRCEVTFTCDRSVP